MGRFTADPILSRHRAYFAVVILTSDCPRRGRREPKVSDGSGGALAVAPTLALFFAALQKVVLPPRCSGIVVRRVGFRTMSGVAPLPATPLRGLRRPLLGQGEVRISIRCVEDAYQLLERYLGADSIRALHFFQHGFRYPRDLLARNADVA